VRGNGLLLTDGHTITGNNYAITAIANVGRGKVAATFDRNTFFNAGVGSDGTDLSEHDNRAYAYNLFNWLARLKPCHAIEASRAFNCKLHGQIERGSALNTPPAA
jgi:hypothetical protein